MLRVAEEILEYLLLHPQAKDTLHGIVRWWRFAGSPERTSRDVETALQLLVAEGFVKERALGASDKIYGGDLRRTQDIPSWIDRLRSQSGRT